MRANGEWSSVSLVEDVPRIYRCFSLFESNLNSYAYEQIAGTLLIKTRYCLLGIKPLDHLGINIIR